ncbi:hypothetical protein HY489_06290 [Candidatus Woesearchaeota archaeon]|nr:hypothetical protein [Candidatus Woesearchaeota archaeon]
MSRNPVFEGIKEEDLLKDVPVSTLRKPLLMVVGFLLLVLVVSLVFSDSLQSWVESSKVSSASLVFSDVSFVFVNGSLERLQEEYVANQHREIKACLFGRVSGSEYIIERVFFPEVLRASVVHVSSVSCPAGVLVDVHSHPVWECLASDQDVSVYKELIKEDSRTRMLVMCSRDRFGKVSI